ncbi:MAG: hypothetical protein H7Z21_14910 [Hymenobacter sp.]|nr:hypothetical protein [Hymenobacter sp.]
MAPDAFSEDLLLLTYRTDLDIFVGRWGYQPEVSRLPAAYAQLTQEALACGCRFWLQDIRRRTFNDPQTTQWLLTEYFPQMAGWLGGHLAVAYLTSPTLMAQIVSGPGYVPPAAYADQPFGIAFFGMEGEALAWLEQQRNR